MESSVADIYSFKGLLKDRGVRIGGFVRLSLIWSKAFYCFSPQMKSLADFNLNRGEKAFTFLAEFAMNLLRKLTLPIRLCNSFLFLGGLASNIAFSFSFFFLIYFMYLNPLTVN